MATARSARRRERPPLSAASLTRGAGRGAAGVARASKPTQRGDLPAPGTLVAGKYHVEYLVGRGGMGAVYAATHRYTRKRVALKVLLPRYARDTERVAAFWREARAAGRVNHPHVIDIFDVLSHRGLSFLVMELLEGKLLSDLMQERLPLAVLLPLFVRAMEGVAAAHAVGVVHRDLKPSNIFVCASVEGRYDDPRVLDFGLAQIEDERTCPLAARSTMGTLPYVSFEQLRGGPSIDARTDVYAIGVLLYEALSGRLPYVASDPSTFLLQLMHAPPLALATLRPDLPRPLCDAVMRALARDRAARTPTMRALIDEIQPYARPADHASKGPPAEGPRGEFAPSRYTVTARLSSA